jgi:hypothetical protein
MMVWLESGKDAWAYMRRRAARTKHVLTPHLASAIPPSPSSSSGALSISSHIVHRLTSRGDDDYFSSDIPDTDDPPTPHIHPLNKSFGTLPTPALALWSEKDEYGFLDDQTPLLRRWETAAGGKLRTVTIKDADHAVSKEQPQADLCAAVVDWLQTAVKL